MTSSPPYSSLLPPTPTDDLEDDVAVERDVRERDGDEGDDEVPEREDVACGGGGGKGGHAQPHTQPRHHPLHTPEKGESVTLSSELCDCL